MTSYLQASLTGGELSPGLFGRVDLARYTNSLELCRNAIVQPYGGIKNRPGTVYAGDVKSHSARVRLIPFQFNTEQTYVLEFGNLYVRVYKDGAQVLLSSAPSEWTISHAYVVGNHVAKNGTNYYCVIAHTSGTFSTEAGKWYALTGSIVEIPTPYTTAQLPYLKFIQSADVMTLVHPSHAPRTLSRTAHDVWALALFAYINGPFTDINTDTTKTVTISAATGTATITCGSAIFSATNVGQLFYLESKNYGNPWEAGKWVEVGSIHRSDGKYYAAYNEGHCGTLRPVHTADNWSDGEVVWTYLHGGFGVAEITVVAGDGKSATVSVKSQLPDEPLTVGSHKWAFCDWGGANGYPSCVCYHQQRLVFAGTTTHPETIWLSRTGSYPDFGTSSPIVEDDAISVTLAATQVQEIRGLLPLDKLVVFTSGGVWVLSSGDASSLSPDNIGARLQGFRGASHLPPLGVGASALYLQDKGKMVRDLGYEFASDSYTGNDLTVMASHLLDGQSIEEWAWQSHPSQCLWCVRDDGGLLSMTYMREQAVVGWARHDTDGTVESVCVVSEDDEDALYLVVQRTIGGAVKRYVERMASREIVDIEDAFFVDSGLSFDGNNTTATTMTLTGGTAWDETETLTATASAAAFSYPATTDVGDKIHYVADDGTVYQLTIVSLTSTTVANVRPCQTIPSAYRSARTDWAWARDTFSGLSHLEGKTVSILADGCVQSLKVVASGVVTLNPPAVVVHVGLPYDSDLQTLDPSLQAVETLMDKRKQVARVRMLVQESRGMQAGRDFDHLYEFKSRSSEVYGAPPNLQTGVVEISIGCTWDRNGSVAFRQSDPLPITWLALIPDFVMGGA